MCSREKIGKRFFIWNAAETSAVKGANAAHRRIRSCWERVITASVKLGRPTHRSLPHELASMFLTCELLVMTERPKDIFLTWVDAFNRADIDALMRHYHDDAVNHQVAEEPVSGYRAIRSMFEREFAMDEMNCIVENLFEDGEWAIMEWRDPLGLWGCGFFEFRNGKIAFQRGYWDKLSFLKQHGLPIPR